jgi:transcriptional regulator with XRE-family HTH domain
MNRDVHLLYTTVKTVCTWGRIYGCHSGVHPVYMAKQVKPRFKRRQKLDCTFIRQWRKHRGLTLARLAERVGTTHATLSRIERGVQPYNQALLEAVADALRTDPPSLLMRNPEDPEGIWSIWDQAEPGVRRQILQIAQTLTKTGS